jgi:Trk K+ transport system NAD-binding subunit
MDSVLEEVGMSKAKAVVCATDDDLANLEIALDAKRMNPRIRVVMRMFDQRVAAKVGGALELEQSFSSAALSAPLVAMQATERGVHGAYRIDGALRVTAEARAGKAGTVADIEEAASCRIIGVQREGSFRTLRARDEVQRGDVLLVDAPAAQLAEVRARVAG